MSYLKVLSLFFALALSTLLLGCTETSTIPGIPFTTGQFVSKITNTTYTHFTAGDLNGKVLVQQNFFGVDGENEFKLEVGQIPAGSYVIEVSYGEEKISQVIVK